jgi:hypothetical protein
MITREEYQRRRDALFARYPHMFPKAARVAGWDIEPGWLDIVERLCADIDAIVPENEKEHLLVVQIKEKFGTLRFYLDVAPPRIDIISPSGVVSGSMPLSQKRHRAWLEQVDALVRAAEQESSKRCLFCGAPGKLRTDQPWIVTACDEHADTTAGPDW